MQAYLSVLSRVESLTEDVQRYVRVVANIWAERGLRIEQDTIGDHIGFQVLSVDDFDTAHKMLLGYSQMTLDHVIHGRRNRCYRFNQAMLASDLHFNGIEIFEPKPAADVQQLRPGIEHIAVCVQDYQRRKENLPRHGIEIAKEADYGAGRFFKTKLIGNVEVEFRDVPLVPADRF